MVNKSVSLISSNYKSYNKVTIRGNKYTKYEDLEVIIKEEINNKNTQNKTDDYISVIDDLKKKIANLPWVEEVVITRSLPSTLNINIKEYSPFAIWVDKGDKYVINKDGKVIRVDDIEEFYYLLILTGKDANLNANSLFNILVIDPEISKDIYSATWVGGRRWDVRFNGGLLVKLPENNINEAWNRLIKIYSMPGSLINLNAIDLRIDKKIYLEYNDQVIKELKSL